MNDLTDCARVIPARPLLKYNPFYLLSAMCMLAGLFALNDSLDWSPLPVANLLGMILILNIYECLLILMGILLLRRGHKRDAATLFVLEAFFLVDAGFLNSEIFTFDLRIGLAVNAVLLILAAAKVAAVFLGLGVPIRSGRYGLVLGQMCLLMAMPGVFKLVASGTGATLQPWALYAVWWIVGLIPIAYLILTEISETIDRHRGVIGAFVILPTISILAHLCTSNWVYHVRWHSANLTPLLLGLAIAIGASDRHVRNVALRMRLQLLLPILAIALAAASPTPSLEFLVAGITINPLRLTGLGAVIVFVHGLIIHRHPYFGIAGMLCLGGAGAGESPRAILDNIWRLIPRTIHGWGAVSVAFSFVLLGIGWMLSLSRPVPVEADEESTGDELS